MEAYGGVYIYPLILNPPTDGGECSATLLDCFNPGKEEI
jgi:hypothetical protein